MVVFWAGFFDGIFKLDIGYFVGTPLGICTAPKNIDDAVFFLGKRLKQSQVGRFAYDNFC